MRFTEPCPADAEHMRTVRSRHMYGEPSGEDTITAWICRQEWATAPTDHHPGKRGAVEAGDDTWRCNSAIGEFDAD